MRFCRVNFSHQEWRKIHPGIQRPSACLQHGLLLRRSHWVRTAAVTCLRMEDQPNHCKRARKVFPSKHKHRLQLRINLLLNWGVCDFLPAWYKLFAFWLVLYWDCSYDCYTRRTAVAWVPWRLEEAVHWSLPHDRHATSREMRWDHLSVQRQTGGRHQVSEQSNHQRANVLHELAKRCVRHGVNQRDEHIGDAS